MSTRFLFFATVAISFGPAISATGADEEKQEVPKAKADTPSAEASPTVEPPSPVGSHEHPQIVRTSVPRLILHSGKTPVVHRAENDISSAIVVGFGDDLAIAWDTRECRWLYAWRGGFLEHTETETTAEGALGIETTVDIVGELIHLSTGPAPLSLSMGATGGTRYYGHRMVDGIPEFLYTVGKLKVSERIFPSEDGSSIIQKFSVERHPVDLILAAPVSARKTGDSDKDDEVSVVVTNGNLKGDYIYVDKKKAGDFTLSHQIGLGLPRPVTTKPGPVARPVAIPLLTQNDTEKAKPEIMPAPARLDPEPEPTPGNKPPPESKPTPKPKADTPPKPAEKKETRPVPVVSEKSEPIITKAQRFDRDILLTDPHVETGSLKSESTAFSDREFKFAQLPDEVVGADHVRTFDRDKYIPGDILSYQLELDSDATVWLMFDKRVNPLPKWLGKEFSNTGKVAVLDSGQAFQILRAQVDAGKLRLGPQDSGAGAHFYLIAASPRNPDAPKAKPAGDDGSKSKSE